MEQEHGIAKDPRVGDGPVYSDPLVDDEPNDRAASQKGRG
jgi:hypothetical protein